MTLTGIEQQSPDTYKFTFEFDKNLTIGIKNGQHIKLHLNVNGKSISRNYTPTSSVTQLGSVDIVAKIYRPNVHPNFPEGGEFTPHLEELRLKDQIEVSGPVGRFHYQGNGKIFFDDESNKTENYKNFIMIAGGTGITPMYQLIGAIKGDQNDKTDCTLVYVNRYEQDILLRSELEKLKHDKVMDIKLCLTSPSESWESWNELRGRLDAEKITKVFGKYFDQKDDTMVLLCGPAGFNKGAAEVCKQLGFKNQFRF